MIAAPGSLADAPIGVFDSGIGGLSVLRALLAELPHERFVYLADNAHAPYGEKGDAHVLARSHAVLGDLLAHHAIKALVIACNTATTATVHALRAAHPQLPFVGIEPALKPAAALTRTGHVGVLATRGTLASDKLRALADSLARAAHFHLRPCDGLAEAIESEAASAECLGTAAQIDRHLAAIGPLGHGAGEIDTLVLGCTHYPLAWPLWQARVGERATLLDPAPAVARQARRVLSERGLLRATSPAQTEAHVKLIATGHPAPLAAAAARWLPEDALI